MEMHSIQTLSETQQQKQSNALKRKLNSIDTSEVGPHVNKRINLSNELVSNNPIYMAPLNINTHNYQISAAAKANLGNISIHTPIEEMSEDIAMTDDAMTDDAMTDEEESLKTPSYNPIRLDVEDEGDLENGGHIGQLERGWNQLFREMY